MPNESTIIVWGKKCYEGMLVAYMTKYVVYVAQPESKGAGHGRCESGKRLSWFRMNSHGYHKIELEYIIDLIMGTDIIARAPYYNCSCTLVISTIQIFF